MNTLTEYMSIKTENTVYIIRHDILMGLAAVLAENNRKVSLGNKEYFKMKKQSCAFQHYVIRLLTLSFGMQVLNFRWFLPV